MEMLLPYLKAFAVGGAFCALGQVFIDYTKPLAEWAGAGATVPLTGFGALLAKGTREAVLEKGLLGVLSGGFTASAAGIAAAVFFGLIAALLFRSGDKS